MKLLYVKSSHFKNAKDDFVELEDFGELPEDTSKVFFVLKKKETRAIYFDSFGEGINTYAILFKVMKNYKISGGIFLKKKLTFRSLSVPL